jgi:hypothetical protein
VSRLFLIFIRLCLILFAFIVAALVASVFLHLVAWPTIAPLNQEAPWLVVGGLFVSVPLMALMASYFAFLPGAMLIGLSELRGYRSWLYHALCGGAAAFIGLAFARQIRGSSGMTPPPPDTYGELPLISMPQVTAAAVAAGLVGGIVYWLIAGRSAGRWFGPVPTAPAPSGS